MIKYKIKCKNPEINVEIPNIKYKTETEAKEAAIELEYSTVKKYLGLDDDDFARKFAKKFWMDNFEIIKHKCPVPAPVNSGLALREEVLKNSGIKKKYLVKFYETGWSGYYAYAASEEEAKKLALKKWNAMDIADEESDSDLKVVVELIK